jgi:hypothetical protein
MSKVIKNENDAWVLRIDWDTDDVSLVCENMDIVLTDEEKIRVLNVMCDSHDAEIGINWKSVEYAIECVIDERIPKL